MSEQATRNEADRLREELAAREGELTWRQANGEDYSQVYQQVMALRERLQRALTAQR